MTSMMTSTLRGKKNQDADIKAGGSDSSMLSYSSLEAWQTSADDTFTAIGQAGNATRDTQGHEMLAPTSAPDIQNGISSRAETGKGEPVSTSPPLTLTLTVDDVIKVIVCVIGLVAVTYLNRIFTSLRRIELRLSGGAK
jgi:hypothetical protein